MQMLIVGCDRTTPTLVPYLAQAGHGITVVDHAPDYLEMVADEPGVETILIAEPQMQDYMLQGGIETADVFLAMSGDDHRNALVAQIAQHLFHVPKVICRLDNLQLQPVYSELGLTVIGTTFGLIQAVHQAIEE